MRVCLLGELRVVDGDVTARQSVFPSRQTRLGVAYLAMNRPRIITRAALAELLWPTAPPAEWPSDVSAVVSKVRAVLRLAGFDGTAVLPGAFGG